MYDRFVVSLGIYLVLSKCESTSSLMSQKAIGFPYLKFRDVFLEDRIEDLRLPGHEVPHRKVWLKVC